MGRKRWWRGGLELLVLCVLLHVILGDGDVGCLFTESLCKPKLETCYNDLAFGRCLQLYANVENEDLYRYDLEPEQLQLLRIQLEALAQDGYKWPHPYTQCIMQKTLHAIRFRSEYDIEFCEALKQHNVHQFTNSKEIAGSLHYPQPIAIVKFTPSDEDPHGDYADELYYPPEVKGERSRFLRKEIDYLYSPFAQKSKKSSYQQFFAPVKDREPLDPLDELNSLTRDQNFNKKSPRNIIADVVEPSRHRNRNLEAIWNKKYIDAIRQDLKDNRGAASSKSTIENARPLAQSELDFLPDDVIENRKIDFWEQEPNIESDEDKERQFSRKYKYPFDFSNLEFLQQSYGRPEVLENSDREVDLDSLEVQDDDDNDRNRAEDIFDSQLIGDLATGKFSRQSGVYTEGGLVQPFRHNTVKPEIPEDIEFDDALPDDLKALLWTRELAGFKRHERLDVKKPGPAFATNNYAFKTQFPQSEAETRDEGTANEQEQNEVMHSPLVKKMTEFKPIGHKTSITDTENSYKNVDLDHVYIQFTGALHTWAEGEKVIEEVGRLLGLEPGVLTDGRVERAEVTFRVKNNTKGLNATDVANRIDEIRGKLQENLGVEVIRAGIGSKRKLPALLDVYSISQISSGSFGLIVAAGAAAAGAAAVVTLIIARRHAKSRAKLAGLTAPDPEASKDYQELCRARMQAKQPNEKADSPRIISLSRESESNNSPSSRSSTSSWSEEPALSNMDISTGHMVLSYMEDHLKNKDRLDQEWTALCAYEAEPSSTAIAENKENDERNRQGAALPYDHSRVVLNDLANINSSDYINASTITDHDPRNPAYIATQGPLPQTAADFWQLVWEQGSVVIVMLTRLTEEGHAMCHRYWPEEGSELFHIYEVHLVSEHIWCDDYLVRSFYLKNLRTGETRTVTQFHFLSWPENGVPHSTKALLEFRRKVNKSYRGRSCPIVVHCSDGAGRTGTYCLIDMVLNRMAKGAKEIDIAATLEHIRDQRPGMVANKQQFEFVLMAVAEEVHAILKALPIPPAEKSPAPTTSNVSPPLKSD